MEQETRVCNGRGKGKCCMFYLTSTIIKYIHESKREGLFGRRKGPIREVIGRDVGDKK